MIRPAFALVCALALAAPGAAREELSPTPDDLSVQAIHNFAGCIADTTPRGAEAVLAMDYRAPAYAKQLHSLAAGHADGRCATVGRLQYSNVLVAGGMAERLLVEKVKPEGFAHLAAYDPTRPAIVARSAMEMTSICVVRAEPAKVYNIFRTDPTSADESRAMQAIAPSLMNCIKAGQKVTLNKPGLRASLALAAYRLALQPDVYPAAVAKVSMGEPAPQ
jgi:hypothetical protein